MPLDMEPGTEIRFTVKIGGLGLRFVRRPVSTPAREGEVAFLDGPDDKGTLRRAVGTFRGGEWRGGKGGGTLRFKPVVWTVGVGTGAVADDG